MSSFTRANQKRLCVLVFGIAGLLSAGQASAQLSVTPITWDVVGLDHNRPLTSGPELFPVGAEVCSSAAVTNVDVDFVWPDGDGNGWDFGTGHPYINLRPGSLTSLNFASIGAGECVDAYFELRLTRAAAAFGQSREYVIQATDGVASASTPSPRAILIEYLVSQNRNTTQQIRYGQQADQSDWAILGAGGSINLAVNETYFIELTTQTSTAYEELQSFVTLSNTIFQVLSVSTTYSSLTAPPSRVPVPNPRLWADGCLWDSDLNSPNYSSCLADGKAGGVVVTIYEIAIISGGGGSVALEALIYDRSGGSFHYNTDYSESPGDLNPYDPASSSITKRFVPATIGIDGTSRLRFTIANPNPLEISGYSFVDNLPAGVVVAGTPNAATTCGGTWNPLANDTALAFDGGTIGANGSCTIVVDVTAAAAGSYDNTSENLFIGTADTGNSAAASLVVSATPPPVEECDDLATLGLWQFPTGSSATAPAPTSNLVTVSTAAGSGLTPTIETDTNDAGTGSWSSDFINQGALVLGNNEYFEFVVDTTDIDTITLDFAARRTSQGAQSIQLYYGPTTGTEFAGSTYALTAANTWFTFGPTTIAANLNPAGNTRFRLYASNSGQNNNGHSVFIDGVSFRGLFCSPVIPPPPVPGVNPPQISKSFSPDPIGVGQQSTLTFVVSNPNPATPLSGIAVSDELPAGLIAVPGTFGGSCTGFWNLDPSDSSVMLHSGGALAGGASCTLTVDVIASTVGTSLNISDLIYSTESGYNLDLTTGVAQAALDVLDPPIIAKTFDPNLVLLGVTPNDAATLSFTLTNPNQSHAVGGVSFSDTYPVGLIVATPPNASTTGCGVPTWAPIASAGSVSFSGGSIAAGGACVVTVDVTGPAGAYPNTSSPVSHIVGGVPLTNGSTASATVVIDAPIPGLALLKEVGLSNDPDAAWSDYLAVEQSDSVYYKLTVENIGEVPLSGIAVSDPSVDISSCTWPAGLPVADLAAPLAHIAVCVVGPVTATTGVQTNTASAVTTQVPGPTTSSATYATVVLGLDKVASPLTYTSAGDVISYTFTVTNTGAAILPGPVTISDPLVPGATCLALTTVGNNDAFFDPLEVMVCTGSYTIQASDVINGSVTNNAQASVAGFDSPTDSATVTLFVAEPTIAKSFATDPIAVGTTSGVTITVTNNSLIALTGVGFSDTLPAGLTFAAAVTANTCGGTATVNAGFDTLTVAGGGIAASGTCSVTIDVNGDVAGSYTNTTSVVSTNEVTGTTTGSDTLDVTITGPTIAKAFVDSLIGVGETTSLTLTVTNTAATALSNVGFSDALPAGLLYAGAPSANTCGGTASVNVGNDTLTLAGGAIAASGTCSVTVDVTGVTAGNYTNTTSVVTSDEVNGTTTGSDTLQVEELPTIEKAFADDTVQTGQTTTLTVTVTNNATIALTNATFVDQLPVTAAGELNFVAPVGGTCGGTPVISTTAGPDDTLTVTGFGLAAGASCTVTVDVQANAEGGYTNTTSVVSSTELTGTDTGSDDLDVGDLPTIAKGFAPDPINAGATSVLTITTTNNAPFALTGVTFSDTLPAGLLYSGAPISDSCGGTTTVNGGADTLTVTGGSIAADSSCTITIAVLGVAGGTFTNTTSVVDSTELTGTTTGSDTLTVIVSEPTIAKSFATDPIAVGTTSGVTITVTNNSLIALTGVGFSDTLPAGLTFAAAVTANTCGGTATVNAGFDTLTVAGGGIAASGTCSVTIDVNGDVAGSYTNTTSVVSTNEVTGTTTGSDTLDVTITGPTIAKAFVDSLIGVGETTSLTLTVTNTAATALSNVGFSDALPAGLLYAGAPSANTCGGTASVNVGNDTLTLAGGAIAASGTCSVTVDVTGVTAGNYTNTTSVVTSDEVNGTTTGSDTLQVEELPTIEKAFADDTVQTGQTTTLTVTVTNNATIALTNATFVDQLPVTAAGELNFVAPVGGTCGGTPVISTTAGPDDTLTVTGFGLAAGASCTVTVDVQANAEGGYTNTTSVVSSTELTGTDTGSDDLDVGDLPTIAKGFAPDPINAGATSVLTITTTNNAPFALTGVTFSDTLPAGLLYSGAPISDSCGGTTTVNGGADTLTVTGGSIAADSSCTITIAVLGVAGGTFTNTTSVVDSTELTGTTTGSDTLTVIVSEPTIAKSFATDPIAVGTTSGVTITVTNNSLIALTGVGFSDTLPAGLTFAAAVTANTCGGTATVNAGFDTLTVAGGGIAASGTCSVTIDVNGDVAGSYTNTTSVVSTNEVTGTTTGSDTLDVTITGPTIAKAFVDSLIGVGETTSLTLTVTNTAATALSNVGFSDALPAGLLYAGAPSANTCGGTASVNVGNDTLTLAGGAIAASGTCSVTVDVTGVTAGNYTNTTSVVTSDEVNGTTTGSDTLQVEELPTIEKAFADDTVQTGQTTTLTVTVTNNATIALTNATFVDQLPVTAAGELNFVAPVGGTCGGTPVISTTAGPDDTLTVTGFGLAAGASCTVTVDVQANAEGGYTNTTSVVSSTELTGTDTGSDDLDVGDLPTIAKGFAPDPINAGATSVLTITTTNNAPFALTGVTFSDTLPAGLLYSGAPISDSCGGTTTVNGGADTLTVTGGSIAADSSCTITIAVLGVAGGTFTNTTSVVDSTELTGTTTGSDTLTVIVSEPTIAKSFATDPIAVGTTSGVTITVTNNSLIALTGVGFSDTLPAGLTFAAAVTANTCGGTATVNAGFDTLTVAGGGIAASGTCSVTIDVNGDVAGSYTNTTSVVSTNEVTGTTTGSDTLDVTITGPTIAKAFVDSLIGVGETTSLTLTVTNTAATALSNVGFSDALPAGLLYAGAPSANTCGGTASVNVGNDTLTLAGGAIAASGTCSVTVDVTGVTAGNYTNTTSVVTSDEVNGTTTGSDTLQVEELPTIEKAFADDTVQTGQTTTLTVTVTNNATIALTNATFVDQLPVTAAGELNFVAPVGGTCGGTPVISTTAGPDDTLTVTGFGLAAGASCTVTVDVQANAEGGYTNTTSVVSSTELTGTDTGSDDLDVGDLPTIAKGFAPDPINAGATSVLTITTTNNAPFALTGVTFSDTLPAGLLYSGAPISDSCGGTTTVNGGADTLTVTGGSIAADSSCTITIAVLGVAGGTFTNTTSVVDSTELTGTTTGSDTLTVIVSEPTIAKSFATDPIAVGTTSGVTITVTNNSLIALTGVGFSDTLPAGLTFAAAVTANTCGGTATVNAGFDTLTVAGGGIAASGTCSVTIDVNGDVAGSYTNTTSVVSTNEVTGTTTGSDTLDVTITGPTIAKAFVDSLIGVGETTSLTLTVTNTAATALSNVGFSDALPAGLLYAGAPSANTCGGTASVNVGNDTLTLAGGAIAASGTCSVTVDVTGVTAGNYTNTTSVVTSDEVNGTTTGSDTLQVEELPTIEKAFADDTVQTGQTTTLTVTVTNNATIALTNATFVDQLPVTAAGELNFVAPVGGTCGGTPVISTTAGPDDTLTVTGFGLAAGASCTVTVDVQANAEGGYTNTTSVVSSTELTGTDTGSDDLDVGDLPTIAKGFAPDPINAGATSVLTITTTNNAPFALTGVTFSDTLPAGLLYSGAPISDSCGGTTTVNGGADTLTVTGGSIAADSSCTITIAVLGVAGGTFTNTTSVVDSTELTGTTTGSDTLTVIVSEPTIAKSFATDPIAVGTTSGVTITVTNNSLIALTGVGFSDTLPAGLTFAAAVTANTCGGTATVNAGFDTLTVAGGGIAASGTCSVTIDVNGDVAGSYTNTTSVVSTNEVTGTTTGSDTLDVTITGPTIAKAFVDSLIGVGETTSLTLTVTNTAATALSNVGFSDALPAGLLYAGAPSANTCGGTASVNVGNDTLTLAGGAIAASGTCSVTVDVTGVTAGNYTNTTSVVTSDEVNGTTTGSDTLQVEELPTIEKAFADDTVQTGQTTTLTVTVTNNATIALTNATFVDQLPVTAAGELNFVAPVGGTCGGTPVISTTAGPDDTLTVTGFGLAAGASCTVTVDVQANAEGGYTNTTSVVSSTELTGTDTGSDDLDVGDLPTIAKGFAPDPINAGATSVLTITTTNNAPFALTGVTFSDTLPAGLLYSGAPISDSCGGTTTVNGGADTLTVTGGSIAADSSCTITIAVLGVAGGTFTNTTSVVDSTELTGTTTGSDTLTVIVSEPTIAKSFATDPIAVGTTSGVTITVTNNSLIALTGVGFSDTLPAGLTFAAAVTANTCGGTATVNAGFDTLTVAGGGIAASGTCSVTIDVNGDVAGSYTNTTSVVSTNEVTGTTTGSDTLDVTITGPTIAKAFVDSLIGVGETTSLTLTVTNTAATALSNVGFSDALPAGLLYAGAPSANTCGGTASVNVGNDTLTLAGGAIAASGTCSVTVDVTGVTAGNYTNTTSVVTSDEVNGTTTGSDTIEVAAFSLSATKADALVVDADFNTVVSRGDTLEYTVEISNTGILDLTGVTFSDTPDANTRLDDSGTVTTTQGTVTTGNVAGDTSVVVDVGTVVVGVTVTITFRVTIDNLLPASVTFVSNQGTVTTNETSDVLTDDPDTTPGEDETVTEIALLASEIPDLGALGQMLLALMLSVAGALMIRRRFI